MTTIDLLATTDAMIWAQEFVKTLAEHPETADPHDEGFMVGWFANAMAAQEMKSGGASIRQIREARAAQLAYDRAMHGFAAVDVTGRRVDPIDISAASPRQDAHEGDRKGD